MRLNTRSIRIACARLLPLVAGGALVVTGLSAVPASAVVDTDYDPNPATTAGAIWLKNQLMTSGMLVSPNVVNGPFETYDTSIDAALTFGQIEGYDATAAEMVTAIEAGAPTAGYLDEDVLPDGAGGFAGNIHHVGRMAKLAVLLQRNDKSPHSLGGTNRDLTEEIRGRLATAAPIAGRVQDRREDKKSGDGIDFETSGPDNANVLDQAWAAEALRRAWKETPTQELKDDLDSAVAFLSKQQCDDGGFFRRNFTEDKTAEVDNAQDCIRYRPNSDFDNRTTAQVMLILQVLKSDPDVAAGEKIDTMLSKATTWLAGPNRQAANGSFRQAAGMDPDVQTTALVALALANAGYTAKARLAAEWVREAQAFDPEQCTVPGTQGLLGETGAIARDKVAFKDGKAAGIGGVFSWVQTTALALPALRLAPNTPAAPRLTPPSGFVHSGATVSLRLSNVEIGERICIEGYRFFRLVPTGSTAEPVTFVAPAGTANRTYVARSLEGADSAVLRVLDTTKFKVKAKVKKIKRKAKQMVVISGLAAGEKVRVMIKGKIVAKGKANSHGKFKKKFKVKSPKGVTVMKVWGQFNDRNGKTKFTVK